MEMKMRFVQFASLTLLALAPPSFAAAQEREVVIRGDAARMEIERILQADNLDTSQLGPREVTDIMASIERGQAPEDFWEAYQVHVRAWERLTAAVETVQRQQGVSTFVDGAEELADAEQAIGTTFEEVERIARRYGARLPIPRANILPTI
jgi:hypothetical protein